MTRLAMTPELLVLIAERFKALGEPARLRLLNTLRHGEKTVTELVDETDFGQANVSKHLHVLYSAGLVVRRREGAFVHYAIADDRIYALCDIMCDQLQAGSQTLQSLLQ
jgi:ArsR family transcriptional regulator